MPSLVAAGMLGLLAACADSRTPQAFDKRMTGFVGRPEAELGRRTRRAEPKL
ncbi:hypothetical protein [Dankookia sp. P2]|uniref:hypothetical protein n=1 Tax=Dankookia sp. P2 TaxID=3423955 RepID=UPI003D67A993